MKEDRVISGDVAINQEGNLEINMNFDARFSCRWNIETREDGLYVSINDDPTRYFVKDIIAAKIEAKYMLMAEGYDVTQDDIEHLYEVIEHSWQEPAHINEMVTTANANWQG